MSRDEEDCIVALDRLEESGSDYVRIGRIRIWRLPEGGIAIAGPWAAIRPAQLRAFITGEPFAWIYGKLPATPVA